MSYTLRGRIESRLAAALVPVVAAGIWALSVPSWWPLELAGTMIGVGLALDGLVYHRLLPYQPGWAALPLGLVELGLTMGAVRALGIGAPLEAALLFFALAWVVSQLTGHALLPLLRLSYADDGGELGRAGIALSAVAPVALAGALGVAWATLPPLVRLPAGVHEGPLVLDHRQRLVGEDGAIVRGGIVIRADEVTVRNVTVVGGEDGIDVEDADDVRIEDVRVVRSLMDGIHVRLSSVMIRDCEILSPGGDYSQGIDISFSMHRRPSLVEGCRVEGAWEGIVSHSSRVRVHDNLVRATTSRGIAVTEMSMGMVDRNTVEGADGVGIFCGDYSMCDIEHNTVSGTGPDETTDDAMRDGYAIQAHFHADAEIDDNRLTDNAHDHGAFAGGRLTRR
jgi:nitrous oxidase accessory protein NosD